MIMETKIQKFQNALPSIFGTHTVDFVRLDEISFAVRSSQTCMICGTELYRLIGECEKLDLSFFVRSNFVNGSDCVEFVIYK